MELGICSAIMSSSKIASQLLSLRIGAAFAVLFAVYSVTFGVLETCQC
jgi:hypothetical protein